MKTFVYNFNGTVYETNEAFDATYRTMKKEAEASGEPFSRQVVCDGKIINQHYCNGIWVND